MRLIICCNHSWPHIGGSEKVVQQIAESMAAEPYNHEVIVFSFSLKKNLEHNGVQYVPCPHSPEVFANIVGQLRPHHIHVYSDCFHLWPFILHEGGSLGCHKSIALVGMNQMIQRSCDIIALKSKEADIFCITHSDNYQDYMRCQEDEIPVTVIPNGVDLNEFDSNTETFDFGHPGKKVVLCVSNFFPGKGQDHLVKALDLLYEKRQDWQAVFMSTTVNFPFAKMLSDRVKRDLAKRPYVSQFFVDVPRVQTIAAFKQADVFAFPSQKEVAPLVAIEAQAARLPWVALPVGNVPELLGGITVPPGPKDNMGYFTYSRQSHSKFAEMLGMMLDDGGSYRTAGRKQVEDRFNWKVIAEQYNKVFSR